MATQKNNKAMQGTTGQLGNVVFRKGRDGASIVSARPKLRKQHSDGQLDAIGNFKDGTRYAKNVCEDPDLKKMYAAKISHNFQSAFHVALHDYLTPPEIVYIKTTNYNGNIGDRIVIKAIDDFKVASVHVSITTTKGRIIEAGEATSQKQHPQAWTFISKVRNLKCDQCLIKVTAKDLPGNTSVMEIEAGEEDLSKNF